MVRQGRLSVRLLLLAVLVALSALTLVSSCRDDGEHTIPFLSDCSDSAGTETDVMTGGLGGLILQVDTMIVFQIDEAASSGSAVPWCDIGPAYGDPYIKMVVTINAEGRVSDISCEHDDDNPAALTAISNKMWKWRWEGGCFEGEIYFEFNFALSRLTYDLSRLDTVAGYENCTIDKSGKMFMLRHWHGCDFGAFHQPLNWYCPSQ